MSTDLTGRLIITWPKAAGDAIPGYGITFTDADTGEQILTALNGEITVRMDARELVTVELEMLADAEGKPLPPGAREVPDEIGEQVLTGRFRWLVAEMRIADE